jgi:hypothetical protein
MESIHDPLAHGGDLSARTARDVRHRLSPAAPRVTRISSSKAGTAPPYRRDFDTLAYSRETFREREGRVTHDPATHMKQQLYPDGALKWPLHARPQPVSRRQGRRHARHRPDLGQVPEALAGPQPPRHHRQHVGGTDRLRRRGGGGQDPRRLSAPRLREADGAAHLHPVLPHRLPHLRAGTGLQRILLRRRRRGTGRHQVAGAADWIAR